MDIFLLRVLSSTGLCDKLITRPEEVYRVRCVVVCDLVEIVSEEALAHWKLLLKKEEAEEE